MGLRTFRRMLAVLFFGAVAAWLAIGPLRFAPGKVAANLQMVPSALGATLGVTLFWIAVTFLFGRLYCSTVCPVGTLQDFAIWARRSLTGHARPSRFVPSSRSRFTWLWIYVVTLFISWLPLFALIEPWQMMRSMVAIVAPQGQPTVWTSLGRWSLMGVGAGVLTLCGLLVWSWMAGRRFCTTVCPVGTALGCAAPYTLFHIEIDPDKCVGCLKCEESCGAGCIKVVSRYVDNSRCVRCFDCIAVCPENAIRYQPNRNRRPASPLMKKVKSR